MKTVHKLLTYFVFAALIMMPTIHYADSSGNHKHPVKGDIAPLSTGIDKDGNSVSLKELLNKGPVVMLFYRGQWCPICNKHLVTLQDSLSYIEEKGAIVIAISPQKAGKSVQNR